MPIKKRLGKARLGYTKDHVMHLACGHDFFGDAFGDDENLLREAWEALKGELLPAWIEMFPGSRPSAFWRFETPLGGRPETAGDQTAYLLEHGLMAPAECAVVQELPKERRAYRAKYSSDMRPDNWLAVLCSRLRAGKVARS